jgi:hypothetical protein
VQLADSRMRHQRGDSCARHVHSTAQRRSMGAKAEHRCGGHTDAWQSIQCSTAVIRNTLTTS